MAAKDIFHEAVRRSLEKEQWIITNDPLELEWEEVQVKIDLGAERLIAADRGSEKIAVEIKSGEKRKNSLNANPSITEEVIINY